MKNVFYSFFALFVLALSTSCQKEDILPQNPTSTAMYGQTIGPGSTQGGTSAASLTTTANNSPTWESWDLCGKPFTASKQQLPNKQWLLTVYNPDMSPAFYANGITYAQLPASVQQFLEGMFPGQSSMSQWQTVQPTNSTFFAEFDQGSHVTVVMVDAAGNLICKGFHP